jgi:uncharacterized phage protein gp47/JayE
MAFQRPTLPEIVDRVQQDFISRLSLSGAVLRRSIVYVFARVVAGAAHMLHGHLEYLSRQMFADQSEAEFLRRQGGLFGVVPTLPGFAHGTVTIAGTNSTVIPAGTVLLRSDGVRYTVDVDSTILGGAAVPAVTAVVPGADGTLVVGLTLTFESPVAGANATGTVAANTQNGSDAEDDEAYRARVLARIRKPPQGGSIDDYIAWAKEVPGVTRVWPSPNEQGAGSVVVRFMRDDDTPSQIPDSGEVAAVQAYIDAKRPVTAAVTVSAPTSSTLNYTVSITPDTVATRAAVQAALADLHRRSAEPGTTLFLSLIRTAIGNADGITNYVLTSPAADVTFTTGQIATLGTITYV